MSSENNSDFTGDDTKLPASKLAFDFEVPLRPVYIPNSGPPLQPISLVPSHKLKGIILDCFDYPKPKNTSHFFVGYEGEPHNRIIVHPDDIRNYVSEYTYENWEHERSTAEEQRKVEELQPSLLASERAKLLRALRKAGLSRDKLEGESAEQLKALGMPKKRGRPAKSMASVFKPAPKPVPDLPGGRRGPGRPRKVVEVPVASPSFSHHNQPSLAQPSISQPSLSQSFSNSSRAILENAMANLPSEEEDDDSDLSVDLQLNKEAHSGSSSVLNLPTVLKHSGLIIDRAHKTPSLSPRKSKHIKKSPHNRQRSAPILPGMSIDAYPYKNSNAPTSNQNKSGKKNTTTSVQGKHPAVTSAQNGESSTANQTVKAAPRSQGKIVDYFKDLDMKSPAPRTEEVKQPRKSEPSLKRKSSPSSERDEELNGRPQSKTRRLGKKSDEYLDADYKGPSKKGVEKAVNSHAPSFDYSPRASGASNLRSSRSRRPESSPDHKDVVKGNDKGDEEDPEEEYDNGASIWAVKSILNHKYQWDEHHFQQVLWYLVDWEGGWDPSWEPAKLVTKEAIDEYIASRKTKGLDDLSVSIDAIDIGGNNNEFTRGVDLERSIEIDQS